MKLGLAAVAVLALVPRVALADDKAECDFLEIRATTAKPGTIDAELKPLEKKLTRPPLSSWTTFHKLSGGHVSLQKLHAESLKLTQGHASLLLRDRKDARLELTIALDAADGKRVIDSQQSVNAGEWTAWVHEVGSDGHILALTCK
ncbi:MAG TPA: hypothetical protein VGF94_12610 [Kofleriaceae bacterium]|jgi:hypothetical protein